MSFIMFATSGPLARAEQNTMLRRLPTTVPGLSKKGYHDQLPTSATTQVRGASTKPHSKLSHVYDEGERCTALHVQDDKNVDLLVRGNTLLPKSGDAFG